MFQTITPQQIIDDCLALTDQDGYGILGSSGDGYPILVRWINNELTTLWQFAKRVNRDAFTKVSSTITFPAGTSSMSMTAAAPTGAAISDWGSPRAVDVLANATNWRKIKQYSFIARDRVGLLAYRFIGDTLYLLPADQATSYPIRVWYLYSAPVVTTATLATSISIPEGSDEYIKQGVMAKIRIRLDDDPSMHYRLQGQARSEVSATLATAHGDQMAIADVLEEVGPELW